MKVVRNPFIVEGIRASFSHPPVLRSYFFQLLLLASITLFMWPWSPLPSYLFPYDPPLTFTALALGFLAALVFFNARHDAGDYEPVDATKVRDFVGLTPVPVSTVVTGKLAVGTVHILFQLLLGLPFLLLTRRAGGASLGEVAGILLVSGITGLLFRCLGFCLFIMLGDKKSLRQAALLMLAATMLFMIPLYPAASPVSAVMSLSLARPGSYGQVPILGASIPFFLVSTTICALAIPMLSVVTTAWLRGVRRQYAAKGR
jgi:hypothetical protein